MEKIDMRKLMSDNSDFKNEILSIIFFIIDFFLI